MTPIQNIEDLFQALEQHPEWRERLLKTLLTEEFLTLPSRMDRVEAVVADLAEEVRALAEGQRRLELRVEELAEGQRQLQEGQRQLQLQIEALATQVQALSTQMQALTTQVQALSTQMQALTTQVQALTTQVSEMASIQKGMVDSVAELKGMGREWFYRNNASAIFGRYLQKAKVMDKGKLLERMNTLKPLTDKEWDEIVDLDLAVEAMTRQTAQPLILAMEISWIVDTNDVERAVRRAKIIQDCGLSAIPVVGGKGLLPEVKDRAQDHQVVMVLDGRVLNKEFLE